MSFDEILEIFRALATESVDYVLVGGIAIGLHGFERATTDVDLFVRPSAENVLRLRRSLQSVFDEENLRRMRAVLEFWSRLRPRQVRHGVFKYHSPAEAQEPSDREK